MIRILVIISILSSLFVSEMRAQRDLDSLIECGICTPRGWSIPGVQDMQRPRGFQLYQERLPDLTISSVTANDSSFTDEIRRGKSWTAKLSVPIIYKEHFKLVAGFNYFDAEYDFDDPDNLESEFYQELQDKSIRSVRGAITAIKSFRGKAFAGFRGSLAMNGDFLTRSEVTHYKSTFSGVFGFKSRRDLSWGIGASYTNVFGVSSLYPIVYYQQRFGEKFAIDCLLPVSFEASYLINEKNLIHWQNKLQGDNYNINLDDFGGPLYLELSDFKTFITYDREIHDFLWLSVSAGFNYNMSFKLSDSDVYFERTLPLWNSENIVIDNSISNTPFVRFGIFMVAPRKWSKTRMAP